MAPDTSVGFISDPDPPIASQPERWLLKGRITVRVILGGGRRRRLLPELGAPASRVKEGGK